MNYKEDYIIGIDEVGYGCIAGPMYVCAFFAHRNWKIPGLADSKTLTENKRDAVYTKLLQQPLKDVVFSVVDIHPNDIEEYKDYGTNVHGALKLLYWRAANIIKQNVNKESTLIILDGILKFPEIPHSLGKSISLPKADAKIPHVSAASIIAKVHRDAYMKKLDKEYPEFNWKNNKGYPTPDHLDALKKHGYTYEHRHMYEPVKSMIKNGQIKA